MKICVVGLWHLGCVTSACLADLGIDVYGLDFDKDNIDNLNKSIAPVFEPGLNELINKNIDKNLKFTTDIEIAVSNADYLWITYDTPVDDNDNADVSYVLDSIKKLFPYLNTDIGFIISSQMPVRSTRALKDFYYQNFNNLKPKFAYSPENLRLGKAIEIFLNPDRIVIGADKSDISMFEPVFLKITDRLEWMGIESAEMTKHAINAFLATSAVFANEIATLCENVGADAKEVTRGLKSEQRIGPKAYVAPSSAIAGGTLNRDVVFLNKLSNEFNLSSELLKGLKQSNDHHKLWPKKKLEEILGSVNGKKIGILGLTYKPGTDTLRRSLAVELCKNLHDDGAEIVAFDPMVKALAPEYSCFINLCLSIDAVFLQSHCVIVCTEWPDFKDCLDSNKLDTMASKIIIDANGFLNNVATQDNSVKHIILGRQSE